MGGIKLILFFLFTTIIKCWPPTIYLQQTVSYNSSEYTILPATINTHNSQTYLYIPFINKAQQTYVVNSYIITGSNFQYLTYTKFVTALPITHQAINILNNYLLVSLMQQNQTQCYMVDKVTLATQNYFTTTSLITGIYASNTDIFVFQQNSEGYYIDIESANSSPSLFYDSFVSNPKSITHILSRDQSKIYTFNKEDNVILVRNISNVDVYENQFENPYQIVVKQTNFQCSCLSSDNTLLFVLLPSGDIEIYSMIDNNLQTTLTTTFSNIISCYHDNVTNNLVFIDDGLSLGTVIIYQYQLSGSIVNTFNTGQINFSMSQNSLYFSLIANGIISIYYKNLGQCDTGYYYQTVRMICMACSTGCSSCSSTECLTCQSNYTLNNGSCDSSASSTLSNQALLGGLTNKASATNLTLTDPTAANSTLDTNTINSTSTNTTSSTSTNTTRSTSANSTSSTSTNSTNSTDLNTTNSTSNTTNSTSTNTTVPVNQTSNSTIEQNYTIIDKTISHIMQSAAMTSVNKIPGGRKVIPFLCFMINIDQLWLYQYHERNYGSTMETFFNQINNMESQKWQVIGEDNIDAIYTKMGTTRSQVIDYIDTKSNYTSQRFKYFQGKGSTFLPACWQFLTFNFIFILVGFILLKWGFNMLFNYKASKLLRAFSSLVFLAPMLFEGNLQYFFFLLFTQVSHGFSLNPKDKIFNVINYLIYFVIVWLSVVSCFLAYYINKKLAKFILGNWRSRINGLLAYSLTNTVRMLVFGAVHSLMRSHNLQLQVLIVLQTIYSLFLFFSLRLWMYHKVTFKVWFSLAFSVLRIVLMVILQVQQRFDIVGSGNIAEQMIDKVLGTIIILYFFVFFLGTAWQLVYEIIQIMTPTKETPKAQVKTKKSANKQQKKSQDGVVLLQKESKTAKVFKSGQKQQIQKNKKSIVTNAALSATTKESHETRSLSKTKHAKSLKKVKWVIDSKQQKIDRSKL